MLEARFLQPAVVEAVKRLAPQYQWRNPVMFVCYIGAIFTTGLGIQAIVGTGEAPAGYILNVSLWLWFTVLFANFAEALAES
ncbi:MAG: potassium-transporting ATPase subunit B, partial [Burkholderiales bacterium]